MFGGGRNDLMEYKGNRSFSVPISIQLLFDNDKLELMKVLCLLNAFSVKSNKQRKVSEILFYYSLVNFDLIQIFNEELEEQLGYTSSPNLYFRFQSKINGILLNMVHLQFIDVKGNISDKLDDIKVKILPKGKQFFNEYSSEYFLFLQNRYISAIDKISFSNENIKRIKGVQ